MADKKVAIYTTSTWPWCHLAKEYLSQEKVPFQEYNVGVDREKAREMIQKSGQVGVPVIIVDDQVVVGFDKAKLEKLLAS